MSSNVAAKIKELVPKAPHLRIGDGLYDKGRWLRDSHIEILGLGLFNVGFSQRHASAPMNSIWELDVGNLVAPGVL